jgi:Fur family transcriptional regulator, peroxide stress response regulator
MPITNLAPRLAARLDQILTRLKERGHRMTPQRVAVVRALLAGDAHPSAEEMHRALAKQFPTMSLATVYKTISLLKQEGEVLELGFSELGNRYDAAIPHPHPHLICTGCGAIADLPAREMDQYAARMAEQTGYRILSHRLDFYGLCPACKKPL